MRFAANIYSTSAGRLAYIFIRISTHKHIDTHTHSHLRLYKTILGRPSYPLKSSHTHTHMHTFFAWPHVIARRIARCLPWPGWAITYHHTHRSSDGRSFVRSFVRRMRIERLNWLLVLYYCWRRWRRQRRLNEQRKRRGVYNRKSSHTTYSSRALTHFTQASSNNRLCRRENVFCETFAWPYSHHPSLIWI